MRRPHWLIDVALLRGWKSRDFIPPPESRTRGEFYARRDLPFQRKRERERERDRRYIDCGGVDNREKRNTANLEGIAVSERGESAATISRKCATADRSPSLSLSLSVSPGVSNIFRRGLLRRKRRYISCPLTTCKRIAAELQWTPAKRKAVAAIVCSDIKASYVTEPNKCDALEWG